MPEFIVSPSVTPLAQDSELSCWATALAMIHNWKYPIVVKEPIEMAQDGGVEFEGYYTTGLPHSTDTALDKFDDAIQTYSLIALPPQTYSLEKWEALLRAHGPLAILTDAPPDGDRYTHIIVVEGIAWTKGFDDAIFYVVDPDGGLRIPMRAPDLQRRLEADDVVELTTMKGWAYP